MNITEKLACNDIVPVLYEKADGTVASYALTHALAPAFESKTARTTPRPDHIVTAYDLTSQRFLSLKMDKIISFDPEF
jgi:hypothetical protein